VVETPDGMELHLQLMVTTTSMPEHCNRTVGRGSTVGVRYEGRIATADSQRRVFADNTAEPEPFDVLIGNGDIILGWEVGLIGLCAGEHATLDVPPELAYGDHGNGGSIPPGASLSFQLHVVETWDGNEARPPMPNLFARIDADGDAHLTPPEVDIHYERLGKPVPPRLWEQEDLDRDGRLSHAEFTGPKGEEPAEWALLDELHSTRGQWLSARRMGSLVAGAGSYWLAENPAHVADGKIHIDVEPSPE